MRSYSFSVFFVYAQVGQVDSVNNNCANASIKRARLRTKARLMFQTRILFASIGVQKKSDFISATRESRVPPGKVKNGRFFRRFVNGSTNCIPLSVSRNVSR